MNLTVKLAAAVVASFAALVALSGYLSLREHRRHSEELVLVSADRVTDLIQRSTRYQMLNNDREALYQMITSLGSEPGIRRIRIFNQEGRISFSTDPAEVNTVVDKQAEACYKCHSQSEPLTRLDRPDRARTFQESSGARVLGMMRPIENQPACSAAACHAHPPGQRILGVIDANLSLASVDAQLAEYRNHIAGFTGVAVLLGSLVSLGFILIVVYKPIGELLAGTKKVAGGDLGHRIPVRSADELGGLAASFNKMTADLAQAREEITAWTRTLEDRVEKKSRQLERAYASMVANEKMASLGKLSATIAHEVNNPLFGILTYSRLALRALEPADVSPATKAQTIEHLHIIERESRRCGEILKNLLAFARQAPPRRQAQNLNLLVERALALVRHQMEMQEIELAANLSSSLVPCMCDGDQVQQVVLALLMNAVEAMPRGGRLEVTTGLDASGAVAQIRVRDSGAGVAADVLPRIFEPFFTTKEDQHGTGLGLAVARNIAEQHGGSVTVLSTPREGTEFTLSLPLESPAAPGPQGNGDSQ